MIHVDTATMKAPNAKNQSSFRSITQKAITASPHTISAMDSVPTKTKITVSS